MQTSETPKLEPKYDDLDNLFIDQQQLESILYHVLVIFNNYFSEQKVSGIFCKIK